MILIDAIYVHNGGGKVLLDYLIQELEKSNIEVFYLLDTRIKNKNITIKENNQIQWLDSSLIKRYNFYKTHKKLFSKIFILGNIPPMIKTEAIVYTYFHNSLYIKQPSGYSFLQKLLCNLKIKFIKLTSKNTNYWLVQSDIFKRDFEKKFHQSQVMVLPFFPELSPIESVNKINGTFLYVSNAHFHKNHSRLIEAFCQMYDKLKQGKLVLTVSEDYPEIVQKIKRVQNQGYPIHNIGFVDREALVGEYQKAEYVIFPSLTESFGLGLIEGISLGCKVIGADLPYTYSVCSPSLFFNPFDVETISKCFEKALSSPLPISKPKIKNQIKDLINLLTQ